MILNTGGRTDTVQYYTDWLLQRFSEGYVLSRNPIERHLATFERMAERLAPYIDRKTLRIS